MCQKLLLIFFLASLLGRGQDRPVNDELLKVSFEPYKIEKTKTRKLLRFKKKYAAYNPLNYAGAGLLYLYQNLVSEQIQANCSYQISCSEYTKLCIQHHGFIIGTLRGFNQLSECHPGAIYEHPQLFINGNKIINGLDKED
ncbi:MAG: membrane protein insertion efficiency factor YidD [Bacteroidia bacterium]|nr:membrane protein insertion efficiency factor YidD [Bacteroidia bacterium]